jgi:hypothetical protein
MDSKFVKDLLSVVEQQDAVKIETMFSNYKIEDFEDAFELAKYNLRQSN